MPDAASVGFLPGTGRSRSEVSQRRALPIIHPDQTTATASEPPPDEAALRTAFGAFATGVTVVTSRAADGRASGITVNSLASVSLTPPLLLWCVGHEARSAALYRPDVPFVVNVLAADQRRLAELFALADGEDYERTVDFSYNSDGVPVLHGCAAEFHCRVTACHPGGDHTIVVGRVHAVVRRDRAPLIFHAGRFRALASSDGT